MPSPPAAAPAGQAPAVLMQGISKRFGAVQANLEVTLSVAAGTVHGIVGENGAGKSTLMAILYGLYQADAGLIHIHGEPARISVLLPAPFSPMMLCTVPAATVSVTSRLACTAPKRLLMPCISTAGAWPAGAAAGGLGINSASTQDQYLQALLAM